MQRSKEVLYFSKEFMDMLHMGSDWFNKEEYIDSCFNSALQKKEFLAIANELANLDIDAKHIMWLLYNDLIVLVDVAGFSTLQNAEDWMKTLVSSLKKDAEKYRSIGTYLRENSDLLENGLALDVKKLTTACTSYEISLKEIVIQLEQSTIELKKKIDWDKTSNIAIKENSFWRGRTAEIIDYLNSQTCLYEDKVTYLKTISYFLKALYPTIWNDDIGTISQLLEAAPKPTHIVKKNIVSHLSTHIRI